MILIRSKHPQQILIALHRVVQYSLARNNKLSSPRRKYRRRRMELLSENIVYIVDSGKDVSIDIFAFGHVDVWAIRHEAGSGRGDTETGFNDPVPGQVGLEKEGVFGEIDVARRVMARDVGLLVRTYIQEGVPGGKDGRRRV